MVLKRMPTSSSTSPVEEKNKNSNDNDNDKNNNTSSSSLDTSSMTTAALPHPATAVHPRRTSTSPSTSANNNNNNNNNTRAVLAHKTKPSLAQYATTSITKHYEINSQILAAFESNFDARRYHVAYAIGMQFVETALLEIPKHGYFYSPRHERERMQSSLDAVRVATLLQEIQQEASATTTTSAAAASSGRASRSNQADAMQQQNQAKRQAYVQAEMQKMEKLKKLALEQVEKASQDQYEAQRAAAEREIRQPAVTVSGASSVPTMVQALPPPDSSSSSSKETRKPPSFRKRLFGRRSKKDKAAAADTGSTGNNSATTTDSGDSWIVLDDWMCPESLTNVLCPQNPLSDSSHAPQQQRPVTLPPPSTPPPPTTSERDAALSSMPTLAAAMPVDQRSRTAPPGGRTRRPQEAAPAPPPPVLSRYDSEEEEQREQYYPPPPKLEASSNWQHPSYVSSSQYSSRTSDDGDYRETIDASNNNAAAITKDWNMVTGETAVPMTDYSHLRQHSADEILLERALYLSGLEVQAPPPPPPTTTVSIPPQQQLQYSQEQAVSSKRIPAGSVSSLHQQQQQQQTHLSVPEYQMEDVSSSMPSGMADAVVVPSTMTIEGKTTKRLELATLKQLYHEDFDLLRRQGRIRVAFADTYQGREADSTNGCTVIAPLLCMHHLLEEDALPDPGLPDPAIIQVIDKETPAILNELRTSLGLSDQAFLIPADVHDYLIENGQLHQSQFVNVVGGNILDEGHLQNLFQALEEAPVSHGKLAATLFFHEHVVAILKLRREPPSTTDAVMSSSPATSTPGSVSSSSKKDSGSSSSEYWYDLIDSLPLKEYLTRVDESDRDFSLRLGLSESEEELSQAFLPMTARVRCLDSEAMKMSIRWYACSKFTVENCQFIDTYDWDDAQSDFDPRVFQAFIWGSA